MLFRSRALEIRGELLRVGHPVDVRFEAGCIADRLVKRGGPAVVFDQPRLEDGSISRFPLAMNLFGTRDRTNLALGVGVWLEELSVFVLWGFAAVVEVHAC